MATKKTGSKTTKTSKSGAAKSGYDTGSLQGDLAKAASKTTGVNFASMPGLKMDSSGQATDNAGRTSTDTAPDSSSVRQATAKRAVETTNQLFGGDPNVVSYGGSFLPGSGGYKAPATNDNYASVKSPVTTSDQASQAVDRLGGTIADLQKNPPIAPSSDNPIGSYNPAYNPASDPKVIKEINDANRIYKERQDDLRSQRDEEIKALQEEKGIEVANLQQTQQKETGASFRNLAYLQQGGISASAQAYMNDMEVGHQREQNILIAKYNTAILQARTAFADKDFALAEKMVENARYVKKEANDRNQQYLDNAIKMQTMIMNQKRQEFDERQFEYKKMEEAKRFAMDNGITQPFYDVGGTVYETSSGRAFSTAQDFVAAGGSKDFSNVYVVKPGSEDFLNYVYKQIDSYPDAGILPTDDFATIKRKIESSAVFNQKNSSSTSDNSAAEYNMMIKQAPAAVFQLKAQGMGWEAIAQHFRELGIDAGSVPEIDDALNRAFKTPAEYEKWRMERKMTPEQLQEQRVREGASGQIGFNNPSSTKTLAVAGEKGKANVPSGTNLKLASAMLNKFAPGQWGNQCGYFVRNVAKSFGLTYPAVGDTLTQKMNTVAKVGSKIGGIGKVMITKENKDTGHVAWTIGKNDKGWIVAESNFGNKEKVTYGRVIPYDSKNIIGFITPTKTA